MKDDHTLLSSGSIDGTVKLWDTRKLFYRKRPCPVREIRPSNENRRVGITSMCLDSTNTRLLVSYYRSCIRLFDLAASPKNALVKTFSGHKNDSFYVKSSFSPDERFVVSGSCDSGIYLWSVPESGSTVSRATAKLESSKPLQTPLRGHTQEVSCVDWRRTTTGKSVDQLVSCSDDGTVRVWTTTCNDGPDTFSFLS
jgi:denticleless